MTILTEEKILEMFKTIDLSMAVFDRDMNMIYMNDISHDFYLNMFKAKNLLGKNLKFCHSRLNIKNIEGLFEQFDAGKPFSFISAQVPIVEGGHLSVLHMPIKKDGKVIGIMEIPMETSFVSGSGNCEYERPYEEDKNFLDFSHLKKDE